MILYLTALILALPLGFQCTEIHAAIGADQCNSASCETEPEGSCLLQSNARKLRVGAHTTLQERTTRRVRTGMSRIERCLRKKPYDPREEKNHQRLLLKRLVVSNLAGAGPNVSSEKVLRYGGVWNIPGKGWIDLIVSAVSPYTPYDVTQNGLFGEPRHASSGMLSVAAGTSVNLSFSFVWNETGLPAVIPHVNVSVLGISANGDGSMAKSVNIYDFTRYYINNDTTLLQAKGPTGGIRFTGTDTAVVNEKPYYFFMSDRQAAQALDVEYVVSTFYMTFSVGPGTGGVNFHFGGRAAISECLGVPKGWGKPSCGVVPKTVPLNEVGWRTVQTGHPLCRETDVDIFMRRVITAQGYCLGSEQSFGSFKRYFNGQCALHDGVKQILRGMKYVHSAQVIHRDLKPRNLLVNANCDLKICDFGLARVSFSDKCFQTCPMTEYVCTRWYRAPEVLCSWTDYTKAIDIWSVGCIFAEMLGRKPVFPGHNTQHQLQLIIALLGTPRPEELNKIPNDKCRKFIESLPPSQGKPFQECFTEASPTAIDFLHTTLQFDPDKRNTVAEALQHPYLAQLYCPEDEPVRPPLDTSDFEFERRKINICALREELFLEALRYYPERRDQYLKEQRQLGQMYDIGKYRLLEQGESQYSSDEEGDS